MALDYGPGLDVIDKDTGKSTRPRVQMVRRDARGNLSLAGPFPAEQIQRYLARGFRVWNGEPLPNVPRSESPRAATQQAAEALVAMLAAAPQRKPGRPTKKNPPEDEHADHGLGPVPA